jgi:hypothetical protein
MFSISFKHCGEQTFKERNESIAKEPHEILNQLDCSFDFGVLIVNDVFGFSEVFDELFPNAFGELDNGIPELIFLFVGHEDLEQFVQ